jgi:hypothetical protein
MAASQEEQGLTDMTRERWQQVRDLLEKALELAPQQRPALLDRACGADRSLRQVEDLLASSDDMRSSFLQGPPLQGRRRFRPSRPARLIGQTISHYRHHRKAERRRYGRGLQG